MEAGSPPKVTIRPQKDAKENPTEIVAVEGRVISTIDKTNTTWSCAQEDGKSRVVYHLTEGKNKRSYLPQHMANFSLPGDCNV